MDLFRFASLAADFCATRKPALSNRLILALNHLYSMVQENIVFKDGFPLYGVIPRRYCGETVTI